MEITFFETEETLLSGPILDQVALHGLLNHIRDMNLKLVSIERVQDHVDIRKEGRWKG
jgi:hypothetical protein